MSKLTVANVVFFMGTFAAYPACGQSAAPVLHRHTGCDGTAGLRFRRRTASHTRSRNPLLPSATTTDESAGAGNSFMVNRAQKFK